MPATHQRDFPQKLRALLFLLISDLHTIKDSSEPRTCTGQTEVPSPQPPPPPPPPGEEEGHKPLGHAMDPLKMSKRLYSNLLYSRLPEFVRMPAAVFDRNEEHTPH